MSIKSVCRTLPVLLALPLPAVAQLSTTDLSQGVSAAELAQFLVGDGVAVSNVQFTGALVAGGTFTNNGVGIDLTQGVVLSSGCISNIIGPNQLGDASCGNAAAGDAELSVLVDAPTNDAAVLSFDFVPSESNVIFSYVFGSEEYLEFVGSDFNDVFALFVNGSNCALVPGSQDVVAINTVNPGSNSQFFRDNTGGTIDTELDGLTTLLTCTAAVTPGATNTLKLTIADTSDDILDSAILIGAGSLISSDDRNTTQTPSGAVTVGTDVGEIIQVVSLPESAAVEKPADAEFKFRVSTLVDDLPAPGATIELTTQLPESLVEPKTGGAKTVDVESLLVNLCGKVGNDTVCTQLASSEVTVKDGDSIAVDVQDGSAKDADGASDGQVSVDMTVLERKITGGGTTGGTTGGDDNGGGGSFLAMPVLLLGLLLALMRRRPASW
ncbi:MAG: choice-of-anchor L domain-containing protein [Pseudomonadota bacterium]